MASFGLLPVGIRRECLWRRDRGEAQANYLFARLATYGVTPNFDNTDTGQSDTPVFPINGADGQQQQFTEELRIASPKRGLVDYVAGLYYFNQTLNSTYPQRGQVRLSVGDTAYFSSNANPDIKTLNYVVFGQANINVASNFKLIAGGRYTRDDITMTSYNRTQVAAADKPLFGRVPLSLDKNSYPSTCGADNFSYKFGMEYKFSPDIMLYVTRSRGYKGPGIGLVSNYQPGRPLFSNLEIPTNTEIGLKSSWFNRRLIFNIDVFKTTIRDFKIQIAIPAIIDGLQTSILQIANAGEVRTRGVEMHFTARPTWRLTLRAMLRGSMRVSLISPMRPVPMTGSRAVSSALSSPVPTSPAIR